MDERVPYQSDVVGGLNVTQAHLLRPRILTTLVIEKNELCTHHLNGSIVAMRDPAKKKKLTRKRSAIACLNRDEAEAVGGLGSKQNSRRASKEI